MHYQIDKIRNGARVHPTMCMHDIRLVCSIQSTNGSKLSYQILDKAVKWRQAIWMYY